MSVNQKIRLLDTHPLWGWVSLLSHRELLFSWTQRDLESRYRGSYLGRAWSILNPLLSLALYTFIFSVILKVRFSAGGHGGFALNLMCGLLPWLAFSETLIRATSVIPSNQNLVKKVVFPLEVLPASLVASALVSQLIGMGVLLIAVAAMGGLKVTMVWLPVLLVIQMAFTLGISWMLASLGVFIRDISQAISLVLNVWMYLTPIVYPASMVPERFSWALAVNPLAFLVEAYRSVILEGVAPHPIGLVVYLGLSMLLMMLGYAWFTRTKRAFADVL